MGNCISKSESYHSRYTAQDINLALSAAGTRPITGDYIEIKYRRHIEEIVETANKLIVLFNALRQTHEAGEEMDGDIWHLRRCINCLRQQYQRFFTASAWLIDKKVAERKQLANIGYFALEYLSDKIVALGRKKSPDFDNILSRINEQIETANTILGLLANDPAANEPADTAL